MYLEQDQNMGDKLFESIGTENLPKEYTPTPLVLENVVGWDKSEEIPETGGIQLNTDGLFCHPNGHTFLEAPMSRFFLDPRKCCADVIIANKGNEEWAIIYAIYTNPQFARKGEATKLTNALKRVFEPQFLFGMSTPLTSEGVRFASKLGLKIVPILL